MCEKAKALLSGAGVGSFQKIILMKGGEQIEKSVCVVLSFLWKDGL